MASIDTGNADRDAHVLSADIVDVARRPTIEFRSTRVADAGDDYAVDGDLTIGGITQPITLAVELGGVETFPGGPRHAGFEATAQIRRKDFDIDVALPPGVELRRARRRHQDRDRPAAARARPLVLNRRLRHPRTLRR